MPKMDYCLRSGQLLLIFFVMLVSGVFARAADLTCASHFLDRTYRGEVAKQWNYYDHIKNDKSDSAKRKLKVLVKAIQNHLAVNGVLFEVDPENRNVLLLKVLTPNKLKPSHPLNHLATSLYEIHDGIRIEINPAKLKLDDAGALFDEDAKRLTLALDNVLDLRADSFVGHELRHAYSAHLEKLKIEHVFMGWLKRKSGTPPLQDTYPDSFSFDELPAYYYQVLVLLRESKRDPESLRTAQAFIGYGLKLLSHLTSQELAGLDDSKTMLVTEETKYKTVKIESASYILEFNFLKDIVRTDEELKALAQKRLHELKSRALVMQQQLQQVQQLLNLQTDIKTVIEVLSSRREVIDARTVFNPVSP